MGYYTVKLTTKKGTVYTYDFLEASSPSEAGGLICGKWQGQVSRPCVDLHQVGEHQWESAILDGVFVQVWEEQEK